MTNREHANCAHGKTYSGFIGNVAHEDNMWVGCCRCGEIIREAPISAALEAEFAAQG